MTEGPERRLVQPIVIESGPDATHHDAVLAAAIASVSAYNADHLNPATSSIWAEWLAGPFTKVARRAKPAVFDKLSPRVNVQVGSSRAAAYVPLDEADVPKELSRLQVSGTDFPRALHDHDEHVAAVIVVNSDLGMTTGKTAAQAAHAALGLALKHPEFMLFDFGLTELPADQFRRELAAHPDACVIVDAGRTETEPGTTTAFAFLNGVPPRMTVVTNTRSTP